MAGLKVGFMGTPDFALEALKSIDESVHEVVVVYSQPPRPKGRGHQVQPSPVHAYAESKNIPVFTPYSVKGVEAQAEFAAHDLDVAIVAAYGLILPKAILEAPKYGCLNIHASILPRWRGASPIQQAIWAGDEETGISIMQMDTGLDTGPVIATKSQPITQETTSNTLHYNLCKIGGGLVLDVLDRLAVEGRMDSIPQDNAKATYAPLLKKEDGRVDWCQSAVEIDRQIRALNPWPGVFTDLEGKRIKILEAQLIEGVNNQPAGTILNRNGDIACIQNTTLRLTKIQPHGSKAMDFISAINGGHLSVGEQFS